MIRATGYLVWRLLRILLGFTLLIAGAFLSLPGVPGPGIVIIFLGLGILSRDFHWAERIHTYLHQKWQQVLNRRKGTSITRENDHG